MAGRNFLIFALMSASLLLASCQTTTQGIGGASSLAMQESMPAQGASPEAEKDGIEVLKLRFDEAIRVAEKAAKLAYERVARSTDQESVYIDSRNFFAGDAVAEIKPVLVRNSADGDVGIIYEVKSKGVGGNFSMIPGYVTSGFFEQLRVVIAEENIPRVRFAKYEQLKDKGITDSVPAAVPVQYEAFARYVDSRNGVDPFEGIWIDSQNVYTLGLIRDDADPMFRHKLFVIESREPGWKAGEVKLKFRNIATGFSVGTYFMANKRETGMGFETSSRYLVALTPTSLGAVALSKAYPREGDGAAHGPSSGSAWHVGGGFFVTNAHVVENGRQLTLNLGGGAYPARQVAIDKKLDLAIVKADLDAGKIPAVPLAGDVKQGRNVYAVGYPLGKFLGESVKITNGIVSALEGVGGDPTLLGFTAAVQPGNSGGPLIDEQGRVVGIVVLRLENAQNVNYAVKVDYLVPLLKQVGAPVVFSNSANKIDVCGVYCSAIALLEVR